MEFVKDFKQKKYINIRTPKKNCIRPPRQYDITGCVEKNS
jgi:hypothetical protein